MRVRIKEGLLEIIDNFFDGKEGHREDLKFLALCEKIEGQWVNLSFVGDDAFEEEDGNFWLPRCCWQTEEEIERQKNIYKWWRS